MYVCVHVCACTCMCTALFETVNVLFFLIVKVPVNTF